MFKINDVTWKISVVPPNFPLLRKPTGEYTIGACDNLMQTIYLSDELSGPLLEKVLCHEITHAAMFSYNIDLSLDQEELVADLISTYGDEIISVTERIFSKLESI